MKCLVLGTMLLCCVTGRSAEVSFGIPFGQGREGDSRYYAPFDLGFAGVSSMRYQQVYGASDFLPSLGTEGGMITRLRFRIDAFDGNGFNTTLTNIQVNLSTTARSPDNLSLVFSENVGLDDTIIVGPGSLDLSSREFFMTAPQPFDVTINLSTPFYYNPTNGNLLLDVRNVVTPGSQRTSQMDTEDRVGDAVSSVFATDVTATSGQAFTFGLVTEFFAIPIPEPSPVLLLLLGFVALGVIIRKKKSSRRRTDVID